MKFCLMINAAQQWQTSSEHALKLIKTMTELNHTVNAVFFYGEAIKITENPILLRQWQNWQSGSKTPLLLCSALVEGAKLTTSAKQAKGFQTVSMGQWINAMESADKVIELH